MSRRVRYAAIERKICVSPIEAGYLLEKMDHPAAEKFSLERIGDENGDPVVTMEIEHNRDLNIDAIGEGCRSGYSMRQCLMS